MFYYVKTPTDELVYDEAVEVVAVDVSKRTAFLSKMSDIQTWRDANAAVKISTLTGGALAIYNAVLSALKSAGAQVVLSQVVARGFMPDGKTVKFIPLATATYVAMWDGKQAYVRTLLGTFPPTGIGFLGWPQTDTPTDTPLL